MKQILLLAFSVLLLSLSSTNLVAQDKMSKKEKTALAVESRMLHKQLEMHITNITSDLGVQNYQGGIKVTLIDDKFTCDLPYQGSNARVNTYGSQNLNVVSKEQEVKVESTFNKRKKRYELKFKFKSEYDSEEFNAMLKVFTNGKVSLEISSGKRSSILYTGGLLIYM